MLLIHTQQQVMIPYVAPFSELELDASPVLINAITGKRFIAHEEDKIKTKKRRSGHKSVHWGSTTCYDSTMTRDEVDCLWYNRQELKVCQEEKRQTIKAIKLVKGNMGLLEGTKYITRGFECYQSIKFNRTIREQRRAVVDSVLQLQRQQRETSTIDPDQMAFICSKHSNWARSWATDLGMKNAIKNEVSLKDLFNTEH